MIKLGEPDGSTGDGLLPESREKTLVLDAEIA